MTFPIKLDRPLVCFDLETTGVDVKKDRIVEIGITELTPAGKRVDYHSLVQPGIPIPAAATAKHGITDDHVVGKPRFEDLAATLVKALSGCDFAGFGINRFDLEVLAAEFRRAGVDWNAEDACVLDGVRLWQLVEPRTLSDFVQRFAKRALVGAHGATADTHGALDGIIGLLLEQQTLPEVSLKSPRLQTSLHGLHDAQFPVNPNAVTRDNKILYNQDGIPVLSFGKHKDVPLHRVPKAYLQWLVDEGQKRDTTRVLLDAVNGTYPPLRR